MEYVEFSSLAGCIGIISYCYDIILVAKACYISFLVEFLGFSKAAPNQSTYGLRRPEADLLKGSGPWGAELSC